MSRRNVLPFKNIHHLITLIRAFKHNVVIGSSVGESLTEL